MTPPIPAALDASAAIAERLSDPIAVTGTATTPGRRRAQSLAGGAAGIALLHIERARSGNGDGDTARRWLTAATREGLSAGPNAGLFFGAPTLTFVVGAAVEHPDQYRQALSRLDAATTTLTRRRLDHAQARFACGERPRMAEFDLIHGLTGLGACLLRRRTDGRILRDVLSYLVRLSAPLPDNDLPGWWTDVSLNGEPSPDFPGGHGNLGMAHGIAAPLALLSLALLDGITVPGHREAIDRTCAWLDTWRQPHPDGPWWPGYLTRTHLEQERIDTTSRQRPSWCYGTPGLARAQHLAGLATDDIARQRTAEAALLGCLRSPDHLAHLTEPGLCHGVAGLLQITFRMAADSNDPDITAHLPRLVDRLIRQLPTAPNNVEFLDGLAGTALALHTAGTGTPPASHFDTCLLLA